jgi:hypothetical protein
MYPNALNVSKLDIYYIQRMMHRTPLGRERLAWSKVARKHLDSIGSGCTAAKASISRGDVRFVIGEKFIALMFSIRSNPVGSVRSLQAQAHLTTATRDMIGEEFQGAIWE